MSLEDETSVEASRLILQAQQVGIVLRALGSVGVGLHCPPSLEAMTLRHRQPKDIDLATRKQDRRELRRFFEGEGYEVDRDMLVAMEGTRYLFRNRARDQGLEDLIQTGMRKSLLRRPGDIRLLLAAPHSRSKSGAIGLR